MYNTILLTMNMHYFSALASNNSNGRVACKLMTTFKLIILSTFLTLISCSGSADKEKQSVLMNADTTKPKTTIVTNNDSISTDTYVARLKDGIEKVEATINDSTIFIATKGLLFIYENYSNNAWIADGRSAYIPPDQVMKVDTPYFKFNFSKWDFIKSQDYELVIAAKRKNIDLNSLIQKIRRKDKIALKEFLHLQNVIDGAAAEEYYYDFWALTNLWTDEELQDFITSLKLHDGLEFGDILINRAPLSNGTEYYRRYYPKTFEKIKTL